MKRRFVTLPEHCLDAVTTADHADCRPCGACYERPLLATMPIQISPSQWWRDRSRVWEESADRFWFCAMHCQHWKLRTASLLHMWTPVRRQDAVPYRNTPPSGNLTFSKISLESSYRERRVFHAENVQTRFAFTLNSCDKILVKGRRPKLLLLNNFVICQATNTDHFGRFKWKPDRLVDGIRRLRNTIRDPDIDKVVQTTNERRLTKYTWTERTVSWRTDQPVNNTCPATIFTLMLNWVVYFCPVVVNGYWQFFILTANLLLCYVMVAVIYASWWSMIQKLDSGEFCLLDIKSSPRRHATPLRNEAQPCRKHTFLQQYCDVHSRKKCQFFPVHVTEYFM